MSEKEKQKLFERISAHVDGESDATREIERLIETDAEAARLYAELSRMSKTMQALPAPDVHPAFATRVVAHVREEHDAVNATPTWRYVLPKILGAFVAVVLIAIAIWPFWPDKGITAPTANTDPVVAEVLRLRNQPDQVLAAQFGSLLSEGETNGAWAGVAETDGGLALVVDPTMSEDYSEVANKVATLLGGENGYDEDTDVFVTLDSLSEPQAAALRALLTDYVEGGSELL